MMFASLAVSAIALAGAHASASEPTTKTCYIAHVEAAVRCVSLRVPVRWDRPERGTIRVAAAVVPALGGGPARPPLLVLPGGPGQAGTDLGLMVDSAFAEARDNREIVLFDPRGMGRSTPISCAFDVGLKPFEATTVALAGARCRERATAFGDEPPLRTIARDIEALRSALGIDRFDLWGGSYGTKYAQAYALLYPSRVRRMILDGAIAVDESILTNAATDADRAWDLLLRSCRAQQSCEAAYPALDRQMNALLQRASVTPLRATFANPATGAPSIVAFDRMALANAVRGALYVPSFAALVPFAVSRASVGDLAPLAALNAAGAAWSTDTMSLGATAAIMCREEAPLARATPTKRGRLIGDSYARYWLTLCRMWPSGGATFSVRPLAQHGPVLILAGGLDPIAPAQRAVAVKRIFPRATLLVAPAGGHTISTFSCAPSLIAAFLDSPDGRAPDAACLQKPAQRPAFFVAS